jgi:hypothetical protein
MLLYIAFEETDQAKFRSISDLADEQKKILMINLNFLKDRKHIWHGTAVLDLFGFPRFKTNEDLQAFLEQD